MSDSNDIKVIVNPYNFNNKLLTENNVYNVLRKFDIQGKIYSMKYYQLAFIHSSYTKKAPMDIGENVVMAKKPEGALELMDGDYERFPDENEGFLTKMRTKLVNGEMLGFLAEKLNFGPLAIMSRHIEDKCKGRTSQHILEDMFEAFVGAMFLDFNEIDNYNLLDNFYSGIGFQICEKFIIHVIEEFVDFSELILKNNNYKEMLTKYFYETYEMPINFSVPTVDGGLNDRLYTVDVLDNNNVSIGTGVGKSKKKSEQYACKDTLINLKIIT